MPNSPLLKSLVNTDTSVPGSRTPGAGRRSSALTKLKTVAFTPMPTAMVSSARAVNPGAFANERIA